MHKTNVLKQILVLPQGSPQSPIARPRTSISQWINFLCWWRGFPSVDRGLRVCLEHIGLVIPSASHAAKAFNACTRRTCVVMLRLSEVAAATVLSGCLLQVNYSSCATSITPESHRGQYSPHRKAGRDPSVGGGFRTAAFPISMRRSFRRESED